MLTLPAWADGLPINAKVRVSARFCKAKTAPDDPNIRTPESATKTAAAQPQDSIPRDTEAGAGADFRTGDAPNGSAPKHKATECMNNKPAPGGDSTTKSKKQPGAKPEGTFTFKNKDGAGHQREHKWRNPDGSKVHIQEYCVNGKWGVWKKPSDWEYIPYNLPELLAAPLDVAPWIAEGPKDADNVAALGVLATTNAGGALNWQPELAQYFKGRELAYVLEDNDEAGRKRTAMIRAALRDVVGTVVPVTFPELPEHGDVSDWIENGGNKQLLLARAEEARKRHATPPHVTVPIDLWAKFDPPKLPVDVLPKAIERFAFEQGELMGADPVGLAMAALTVCGAAIPDNIELQVKKNDPP
jgi:hypothetical protein